MRKYVMWNTDFRDNISVEELNKKIDDFIRLNPNTDIVLQVPSTKGATSSFVQKLDPRAKIRIAAAYDEERVERYKNVVYDSGATCKEAHIESVIYTRNETIKILREIEEIEKGLMPNWYDFQKALYIYDKIKTTIMYDPKYKKKSWAEIRSLRGLITKQTVCAGYSMIYKEILERNGIRCKFVAGHGHAWNVVVIDDVMYSADLTSDNYSYRHGEKFQHLAFGQDEYTFNKKRTPEKEEPEADYIGKLVELDTLFVEKVAQDLIVERDYELTANTFTRNDGTKFYLAQVGIKSIPRGRMTSRYCRYYYVDINRDGSYGEPKILYAYVDVFKYLNQVAFGEPTRNGYAHAIINVLFSKENIRDSERRNSGYIGEELRAYSNNPVSKVNEINKDEDDIYNTQTATRIFTRSDGTKVVLEAVLPNDTVNGKIIYRFKAYDLQQGKTKYKVRANIVYSEDNLLTSKRKNIGNYLLSRTRLETKAQESGGYVGYIDDNGKIKINKKIAEHYSRNKRVVVPNLNPNRPIVMPNFTELEDLARTYEILIDPQTNKLVVRNIKSKKIIDDDRLSLKAVFANIWLVSAGLKPTKNEQRKGVREAFSTDSRHLYKYISDKIIQHYQRYGYIDTVALFSDLENSNYKDGPKIVANLFKNEFQSSYVHNLFFNIVKNYRFGTRIPQVLHDENRARQLRNQTYINRY